MGIKVDFETECQSDLWASQLRNIWFSFRSPYSFYLNPQKIFLSHFSFCNCSSRTLGYSCKFISLLIQFLQIAFETLMNGTNSQLCFQWILFFKSFYNVSFAWKNLHICFEFNSDFSKNLGLVKERKTPVTKECNIHLFSTL